MSTHNKLGGVARGPFTPSYPQYITNSAHSIAVMKPLPTELDYDYMQLSRSL